MLPDKMEKALNAQIGREFNSGYVYLAMAGYCEARNLSGFANWFRHQYQEENEHALRLFGYVLDRGGRVDLGEIDKPRSDYGSVKELFETGLAIEMKNTEEINELYSLAIDLKDYATQSQLQWFIDEQVEEEKSLGDIVSLVEMAGEDKSALLMLNRQMGERAGAEGGTT